MKDIRIIIPIIGIFILCKSIVIYGVLVDGGISKTLLTMFSIIQFVSLSLLSVLILIIL